MNYIVFNTPLGFIKVIEEDDFITKIEYEGNRADEVLSDNKILCEARNQIEDYFMGARREFDLPVKINATDYRRKVFETLRTVPYGTTISYKELATLTGNPAAYRAVGSAMKANPLPIIIPCHRVINENGELGNYSFGGVSNKDWLITFEAQNRQPLFI